MAPRVSPASKQNVSQRKQALTVSPLEDLVQAAGAGHICEGQSTDSSSYAPPLTVCCDATLFSLAWKLVLGTQQVTHQALFSHSHLQRSTLH